MRQMKLSGIKQKETKKKNNKSDNMPTSDIHENF